MGGKEFHTLIMRYICTIFANLVTTSHHNRFTALFQDYPGEPVPEEKLLDFMMQRKINRSRHTDQPAGRHSIWTNQCPPPPSQFFTDRMPFMLPNQQWQSTSAFGSPQQCYPHLLRTIFANLVRK